MSKLAVGCTSSKDPCASACHAVLDPLGFAFENYDAIGRYRTTDNKLPVDAHGSVVIDDDHHRRVIVSDFPEPILPSYVSHSRPHKRAVFEAGRLISWEVYGWR